MLRLVRPSVGKLAVLLTLLAVAGLIWAGDGWMFSPGPLNAQARGSVGPGGVASHAELCNDCSACHVPPWSSQTMADRCLDCHADVRTQLDARGPLHGKFTDGRQCRSCHTEHRGAHATLTNLTAFDHKYAAFKLTGKHLSVECKSCHLNNMFKGTAQTCVSCHAEPQVHLGKFGSECAGCHTTSTWKGGTLTRAGLAHFDHNTTAFKLTGKHTAVECQSCHVNNVFKGTAQTCVSCHAEPAVHLGKFGKDCTSCHSTTTWKGAVFAHKFPINHGNKRVSNACATCHTTPDYTAYTCYGCHKHVRAKIEQKHMKIRLRPGLLLEHCAKCHSDGKERRRVQAPTGEILLALLDSPARGCPVQLDAGMGSAAASKPWFTPASHSLLAASTKPSDDWLADPAVERLRAPGTIGFRPARQGQPFGNDWEATIHRLVGAHFRDPSWSMTSESKGDADRFRRR